MDNTPANRIRISFQAIAPRARALVDLFYTKLFANYPQVRQMFPPDMTAQHKALLGAVGTVVKHADSLDAIRDQLLEMGARHAGYGVKPEHYPIVRDTLLGALAETAGSLWTEQLRRDWAAAIDAVAAIMLEGARNPTQKMQTA